MSFLKELLYRLRGEVTTEKLISMGMKVGKNFGRLNGVILDPSHCWLIEIGDNVTMAPRVHILCHDASTKAFLNYTKIGRVTIGNNVFIGPDCGFYTAGHPIKISERNTGYEYSKPITVGNNVWIGGGVKVMPGVTIGDNTTIGAGSVVTKDIPDGVVAFGNPCRVHRKLTEEEMK